MALENFTVYNPGETDVAGNRLAITATTITVTGMRRDEDVWHIDDKGEDAIGDFLATWEWTPTGHGGNWAGGWIFGISTDNQGATRKGSALCHWNGTSWQVNTMGLLISGLTNGVKVYLSYRRIGAAHDFWIHSNAARTVEVGHLSNATGNSDPARYLFPVKSKNDDDTVNGSWVIGNLEFTLLGGSGSGSGSGSGAARKIALGIL